MLRCRNKQYVLQINKEAWRTTNMNCKENYYIVHSENRYYTRCWL